LETEIKEMMFLCKMISGQFYQYEMIKKSEFDEAINRYNKECGGVLWAKLLDAGTGGTIQAYPSNVIRFIKE